MTRVVICLFLIPCMGILGCGPLGSDRHQIRVPAAAGSFYPAQPGELHLLIQKALQAAPDVSISGKAKVLLVPHAGYRISGILAARGLKLIRDIKPETIYVIGTAHYADRSGALVWLGKAFQTPLGDYPVDIEAVRELMRCPDVHLYPGAWIKEHSVEVQVPFLQVLAPSAKLVPLLMGTSTWEECWSVARALASQAAKRRSVIVVSSDLSHFPTWGDARAIDQKTLKVLEAFDPYGLDKLEREIGAKGIPNLVCSFCGLSAMKTAMLAASLLGANTGQVLQSANSGDITGDKQRVVGYAAAVLYADPQKPSHPILAKPYKSPGPLSSAQRSELLRLARASIAEGLATKKMMRATAQDPVFLEPAAVYVTLRRNGHLRGCVGGTEAFFPLYQSVVQMAYAAAFEDPRFKPLNTSELTETEIEISILSPLTRIADPKEIKLGQHGVIVRRDEYKAVFLPQVAKETGWDRETLLNHLCLKARLPKDSWRDRQTQLYRFTVETF